MKVVPVRRDVKVNLNEARAKDWHEAGAHVTHFLNALSIFFPAGERMFMDSVRAYKDQVKDPELKKAVTAFIGQEALHSREHEECNEMLDRAGLPATKLDKFLWKLLAVVQKGLGKKLSLAATIALEHYTAILANAVLSDKRVLGEQSELSFKQMWTWHAYEETEHKAVAYDVWNEVMPNTWGNRMLRRAAMVITTAVFWPLVMYFHLRMVFADPNTSGHHLRGFWTVNSMLWGELGVLRKPLGEFFDYFKADFHPWMHDNSAYLAHIDAFVEEVNNTGRLPNEAVKKAVRTRLSKSAMAASAA